jgi:hypothetical protein
MVTSEEEMRGGREGRGLRALSFERYSRESVMDWMGG